CISKTLRSSDIFAQYSVSQFILLMPFTTFENSEKAMKRVLKRFNKQYYYSPLLVVYSFQPLDIPLPSLVKPE
ncbi:MAG: hypothetical protein FWD00_01020, partial [Clostridiales bacterium]|nr:hypothetical protein [Clostridiales bacterium]